MARTLAAMAAALAALCAATAQAEPSPQAIGINDALLSVRRPLTVGPDGALGGDGAALLKDALKDARYIAVGEDHFTREIPQFVSSVCDLVAPDLTGLALEVGPRALKSIEQILQSPDRVARMSRFNRDNPDAIAFLDGRADNAMAAHCARTSRSPNFRLIGADQEFLGSAGVLLDQILATRLSPRARRSIVALRNRDRTLEKQAQTSGDPAALLLLSLPVKEWDEAAGALRSGGNPEARQIFADLRESHEIYALNSGPTPEFSNERRARLLKRNLLAGLPKTGKVILKFGDWHLYKGINPLHQRDLGNFIAEHADGEGARSLHILVLGAKGVHATYAGHAKPLGRQPFVMSDDRDYRWFKAAADNQVERGWTLFDLRQLRFKRVNLDVDWRRAVDGYDLMIVVPELTPSDRL